MNWTPVVSTQRAVLNFMENDDLDELSSESICKERQNGVGQYRLDGEAQNGKACDGAGDWRIVVKRVGGWTWNKGAR